MSLGIGSLRGLVGRPGDGLRTVLANCSARVLALIGVTVGTKVTGADGTIDTTNISNFTADGTLAVHTVGSEAQNEVITTRSGLSAAFSHFSFGGDHYTVTYVKNSSGVVTGVEVTPAGGAPPQASPWNR